MVRCKGDEDEEDEQERLHVLTIIENRHLENQLVWSFLFCEGAQLSGGVLERVRRFYVHLRGIPKS